MDLKGSLTDTNVRIYPTKKLIEYIEAIKNQDEVPQNILNVINKKSFKRDDSEIKIKTNSELTDEDYKNLDKITNFMADKKPINKQTNKKEKEHKKTDIKDKQELNENDNNDDAKTNKDEFYLITQDVEWLYHHIQQRRSNGSKDTPYLHELLEGAVIEMPENEVLKRNPELEARCVKLRAQQEAREYRKMTKGVDNVRMRFPDESIAYQMKQLNRQLIAVAQFLISIFAGFLFGFRGVEWMVGNLDFGFRLLLGVMCALVIALAEIYFLAKKLNEELNIPETTQLGGPPKFVNQKEDHVLGLEKQKKVHQD